LPENFAVWLDFVKIIEFFPCRACTDKRIPECHPVLAWIIIHTFDKMDFVFNAVLNLTKVFSFPGKA
jgi:hypothetical protein